MKRWARQVRDRDVPCWTMLPLGVCGHTYRAHEHWRAGEDCGVPGCDCPAYRGEPLLARLARWVRGQ